MTLERTTGPGLRWSAPSLLLLSWLVVAVLTAAWLASLWQGVHTRLDFDDAYMFYRYAIHARQGLGVSWNPDGVHTYGQTAPLWGAVVLLLSYLPLSMSTVLRMGSAMCSAGTMLAIAWAVASHASGGWMRSLAVAFPLVALPLSFSHLFRENALTGMETMLAMLLCAAYLGAVLGWQRGAIPPAAAAGIGFLLVLTRPEAALVVVALPVFVHLLLPGTTLRGLTTLLAILVAALALEMLLCRWYFGTALPLSFYMKSRHGYAGYIADWHPVTLALNFFAEYRWYLAALVFCMRKADWRLVTACIAPALLVFGYLISVTQIMGFVSRYYMPYLPLLTVPALLVLDRRLQGWNAGMPEWGSRKLLRHGAAVAVVFLCTLGPLPAGAARVADRALMQGKVGYDPVVLTTAAGAPLPPVPYLEAMWAVTDALAAPMPGLKIAASEVGYLGAHAPGTTIIDLAGLNDTQIALNGFSMTNLLARRPDVIWMPHPDYTWQRGVMLGDPALLAQYDVYAGAANYGIAVRKDSPRRAQIDAQMLVLWKRLYPGRSMDAYRVRSAGWTGQKYTLHG